MDMEKYFDEELQKFRQLAELRNLKFQDLEAEIVTDYYPGRGGTMESTPDIKPSLSLVQKIKGRAGEIEIELYGEIIPSTEGLQERVNEYFNQYGYVPLSEEFLEPLKLTFLKMDVTYRSKDYRKVAGFMMVPQETGKPKKSRMFTSDKLFKNLSFDEACEVSLDLVVGKLRI